MNTPTAYQRQFTVCISNYWFLGENVILCERFELLRGKYCFVSKIKEREISSRYRILFFIGVALFLFCIV